jgi:3-oxoacyl-[acyl-carrier-protein] synthase II
MRSALRDAGAEPGDVGHLHAHGLGSRRCDAEEARAIAAVFGPRGRQPPIVAAKSHFGNLGAGGGAVELIASVLALRHGTLFPVLNYETPDPACDIAINVGEETSPGGSFLNVNVTQQGHASCLMVRAV